MRLIRYADPTAFATRAEPFLAAHEAEHCLAIGILNTLLRGETFSALTPYLAMIEDGDGQIVEAVVSTPPHNLILSLVTPSAESAANDILRLITQDAYGAMPHLAGVHGPVALARSFAERWERLTGARARLDVNERIYRLTQVRHVRSVSGAMRRITEADRPLLREWLTAFFREEALGNANDPGVDLQIERRLRFESSGMYLWETEAGPVSLAGYSGPTPHGMRVGPVYTPPEARSQGYASALVAALSQLLLDAGRQFVFLFTDLSNPTSNHIYQDIGYEPVSDVTEYRFERPS